MESPSMVDQPLLSEFYLVQTAWLVDCLLVHVQPQLTGCVVFLWCCGLGTWHRQRKRQLWTGRGVDASHASLLAVHAVLPCARQR